MVPHGDAEAHYSFPPRTHCPGWWGLRKSSSHAHFFSLLLHMLLIVRHASPGTSYKTGHAHFFLQNHFLLKVLPHKQVIQWPPWQFSFSASELGPAEGLPSGCRAHRDQ